MESTVEVTESERRAAFEQHVVPHVELLLAVAWRFAPDRDAAEDLVQDTLLKAYRAIHRFDGRHPRAWLLTILRNTAINESRRRNAVLLFDPEATLARLRGHGADARDGAAEPALARIVDQALVAALQTLSRDHLAVVALVDVDGLTYREAADVLDVPVGTVTSRLHRARRRLRRALAAVDATRHGEVR